MAQHDYSITNQTSASLRADLNNALAAIVSQNSGATAPATTFANQFWYDTSTDTLKQRNESNTVWISLGTVDQTNNKFEPNQTFATQAEAEAGSNNTKPMTALRTAQAIAILSPAVTPFETWANATFLASSSFTIPANKKYLILACGGGGSGATVNSGSVNSDTKALGGNGGSVVLLRGETASSTVLTVTVGGGGASRTSGTGSGNAGGNTTVTGTGINISASGGRAGTETGTSAISSTPNAASSGGTVYECGLWNVGTHTDGNISFSGTAPFGGGGTTFESTTTGMSSSIDAFNATKIGQSMGAYNVFTYDQTALIWPLMAQELAGSYPSATPTLASASVGGTAGDASTDTDGGDGAYGGGGGGAADSSGMSSGAGGSGWVTIWVEK